MTEVSAGVRAGSLLDGLRVLDLSLWQPGHTATQLLADLGADVLKIEPPGGDRMRPQVDRFVNYNGRKRSLVLNLKDVGDRGRLLDLVAETEVVVENYRPGVADRLGVGFEVLRARNSAVVLCSITGFGQRGPLAGVTGHDPNFQAYAGAFTVPEVGEPVRPAVLIGDQGGGLAAAFAILAAVICARRTGEAEHIDVSITDLLATWVAPHGPLDERREGAASGYPALPAMGTFATRDGGWVVLGVHSEDHLWDELCRAIGLNSQVGLTLEERSAQAAQLRVMIGDELLKLGRDEAVDRLSVRSIPIAPVLSRPEMLDHPHFYQRGVLTVGADGWRAVGHPIQYAIHPALPPGRAPDLDEH
jgi:crotonobetainyl-CoA:carnitine CoA-transferase CaiB-like acyl-CoA transferase